MATKRTRLKARNTPQSTERKTVKKRSAIGQARRKIVATPTAHAGKARIGKRVPVKVNPRKTATGKPRSEQKTPPRTRKAKSTAGTNRKATPKDEYEFDETDDFLSGNSFLSASFTPSGSKKVAKSGALSDVKSSKSSLANQQKGKPQKAQSRHAAPEESKKKTSTPLSDVAPKGHPNKSQGKRQRYLQVSVPQLDLDMSVTPILPISINRPLATRASPRQKANKSSDAKSVSFKESVPSQTPAGLINHKKTQRQLAVAQNLSSFSASGSFKEPAPVLPFESAAVSNTTVPRKGDRKRKSAELDNSFEPDRENVISASSAKRKKSGLAETNPSPLTSKKNRLPQKVSSSTRGNFTKKQTLTRQTKLELGSKSQNRKHLRQRKPVTSTPVPQPGEEQREGKEAVQSTPPLYDSGISMGDDLSTSGETNSAAVFTLPGFMEDEPAYSSVGFLENSPLSAPSSSSKEVPALYKSLVKEYKPAKTKRERGRYSTSKIDAWATAVNQSLQDVESFELVVE